METTKKPRGGNHRAPTGNVWKHTTMTLKPTVWNEIKKASAIEIDNCSRWAIKKIKEYKGIPPVTKIGTEEKSIICPLCFTQDELDMLKVKAENAGMNKSQFFSNVMMDVIARGL